MWSVFKIDQKKINLLKEDFKKLLGDDIIFYNPKIIFIKSSFCQFFFNVFFFKNSYESIAVTLNFLLINSFDTQEPFKPIPTTMTCFFFIFKF